MKGSSQPSGFSAVNAVVNPELASWVGLWGVGCGLASYKADVAREGPRELR
jgi:hypothetical protein